MKKKAMIIMKKKIIFVFFFSFFALSYDTSRPLYIFSSLLRLYRQPLTN